VVHLAAVRSGPTCTKLLADFGARSCAWGVPAGERGFHDAADPHRNKRSAAVNLPDARGVEILERLAARAGVIVESCRPDVKRRLGIDGKALPREDPRLIHAGIPGFGEEGPYRERPRPDQIVQVIQEPHGERA